MSLYILRESRRATCKRGYKNARLHLYVRVTYTYIARVLCMRVSTGMWVIQVKTAGIARSNQHSRSNPMSHRVAIPRVTYLPPPVAYGFWVVFNVNLYPSNVSPSLASTLSPSLCRENVSRDQIFLFVKLNRNTPSTLESRISQVRILKIVRNKQYAGTRQMDNVITTVKGFSTWNVRKSITVTIWE